jgi:hypothetical protein
MYTGCGPQPPSVYDIFPADRGPGTVRALKRRPAVGCGVDGRRVLERLWKANRWVRGQQTQLRIMCEGKLASGLWYCRHIAIPTCFSLTHNSRGVPHIEYEAVKARSLSCSAVATCSPQAALPPDDARFKTCRPPDSKAVGDCGDIVKISRIVRLAPAKDRTVAVSSASSKRCSNQQRRHVSIALNEPCGNSRAAARSPADVSGNGSAFLYETWNGVS